MSTLCHTCLGSFLIKQISVVKLQFLPLLQRPVLAFLAHRLSSGCGVRASHCGVFLWLRSSGSGAFGLQWLWHVGSAVRFPGSGARALGRSGCSGCGMWAQRCSTQALGHGLSHCGMWAQRCGSQALGRSGCSGCGMWAQQRGSQALGHGLWGIGAAVAVACGLSHCGNGLCWTVACGVFPDQGSNPCPPY